MNSIEFMFLLVGVCIGCIITGILASYITEREEKLNRLTRFDYKIPADTDYNSPYAFVIRAIYALNENQEGKLFKSNNRFCYCLEVPDIDNQEEIWIGIYKKNKKDSSPILIQDKNGILREAKKIQKQRKQKRKRINE